MSESQCSHCSQPFTRGAESDVACPPCRQAQALDQWQTEGAVELPPSPPAD
jgi:uncharacterized Zn finger protein (UPF0148 family)